MIGMKTKIDDLCRSNEPEYSAVCDEMKILSRTNGNPGQKMRYVLCKRQCSRERIFKKFITSILKTLLLRLTSVFLQK